MKLYVTLTNPKGNKKGMGHDVRVLAELTYGNRVVGTIGLYSIKDAGQDLGYRVVWDSEKFPGMARIIEESERGRTQAGIRCDRCSCTDSHSEERGARRTVFCEQANVDVVQEWTGKEWLCLHDQNETKGEKQRGWQAYQGICAHKWYRPFVNEEEMRCSLCGKSEEKGKLQTGERCRRWGCNKVALDGGVCEGHTHLEEQGIHT